MNGHLIATLFALDIAFSVAQFSCPSDGNHPLTRGSCKTYYECSGGIAQERFCQGQAMVFNTLVNRCTHYSLAPMPCSIFMDCTGVAAGVYAYRPTNCRHYYTCQIRGVFMGAIACTPGTVFDERPHVQTCSFTDMTPPPCGTYTGPPTTPFSITTPFVG